MPSTKNFMKIRETSGSLWALMEWILLVIGPAHTAHGSNPVDLQPPSMVVLEEEVFIADHYNFRAQSTRYRDRCFSRAIDASNGDTMEARSENVGWACEEYLHMQSHHFCYHHWLPRTVFPFRIDQRIHGMLGMLDWHSSSVPRGILKGCVHASQTLLSGRTQVPKQEDDEILHW